MFHYIPAQAQDGAWHVAYCNHRLELVAVMDCGTFEAAYREAAAMTLEATKRLLCQDMPDRDEARFPRFRR